jgi:hypothetical protein
VVDLSEDDCACAYSRSEDGFVDLRGDGGKMIVLVWKKHSIAGLDLAG